jgi:hypothetical protein
MVWSFPPRWMSSVWDQSRRSTCLTSRLQYCRPRCIGVLRGTLISVTQLADRASLANRLMTIKVWLYTSRACTVGPMVSVLLMLSFHERVSHRSQGRLSLDHQTQKPTSCKHITLNNHCILLETHNLGSLVTITNDQVTNKTTRHHHPLNTTNIMLDQQS